MYVTSSHLLKDRTYRQDWSSSREIHQACRQQFCKLLAETKIFAKVQVRSKLTDPETGRIAFSSELIAGGSAGGAQVLSESLASHH
jgi:hypothetical protein